MSQTPGIGSSREDRPSSEFLFSRSSASPFGAVIQETVLNPEGRRPSDGNPSAFETGADFELLSPPDSHVSKRLFPGEAAPVATADVEAPAGSELGHFAIEERIGSGGMGAVFRALDTRLQRVVALKVLSPSQSRDRAAVLRFQNEARAAARLDHENIARVHYIGEDRGLHFIAFEYVTGQNVRDLIARSGRLPVADAVNYVLQIATALRHTAAAGVVHRDIKPSNIIITPNGRAKLVDLGLARKLAADSVGDLTIAGTTLGTFDYISPEQARDPRNVDVRSDIYSLGCTLYHMLTGGPPYSSGTVLQKLLDHQSGQAPDPRALNPQVPPALSAVCRKMMAGDPRSRYATPDDLIRDLAAVAAGLGLRPVPVDSFVWSRPPKPPSPGLRPGLVWAGSVAVVVLLAVLVDRWPAAVDPEPVAASNGPARASSAEADRSAGGGPLGAENGLVSDGGDADVPLSPPLQSEPPLDESFTRPGTLRTVAGDSGQAAPRTGGDRSDARPSESPTSGRSVAADAGVASGSGDAVPAPLSYTEIADQAQTVGSLLWPVVKPFLSAAESPEQDDRATADAGESSRYGLTKPFVLWAEGAEPQGYDTLAEAVEDAYSGDKIELHYDGRRPGQAPEEPIVIDEKSITIAAGLAPSGQRHRPVLEFAGDPRSAGRPQMIVVSGDGGELALDGVELRVTVSAEAGNSSRQWAVFSLPSSERVRLRDVAITLVNPRAYPLSVFDLRPPEDVSREAYEIMKMGSENRIDGFLVELENCLVRGGADLVTIAHTLPGRIVLRHSAVALDTDLLSVTGGLERPSAGDTVDVELTHVTAMVDALLRLDVDLLPRHVATIRVDARDSVFATGTAGPLVHMTGNASAVAFEQALVWNGRNNVFDGFSQYWSIYAEDGAVDSAPTTFALWKSRWSGLGSADPDAAERSIPADDRFTNVWAAPEVAKFNKLTSRSEIEAEDLALDLASAPRGWLEATDGGLIGAPPDELPPVSPPPGGLSAAGRPAQTR